MAQLMLHVQFIPLARTWYTTGATLVTKLTKLLNKNQQADLVTGVTGAKIAEIR
jgi:hypothetical protein